MEKRKIMKVFLMHNPYKIETVFRTEEKVSNATWFSRLTQEGKNQKRLQMWITPFFDELKKAYPKINEFIIKFVGLKTDCDDVENEAKLAEKRLGITFDVDATPSGDPIHQFQKLKNLYNEALEGPYDGFRHIELSEAFKSIEDSTLSVSIMAPMKNGKSTLINAFLGQDLLPSATQRCTAKISYIEHIDGITTFQAKPIYLSGKESDFIPCDNKLLGEWNQNDDVRHVKVQGELPGIRSVGDYNLRFIDTPGPDSAIHKEDLLTIERFLSDTSLPMVVYIIDRVNIGETNYLERLKQHMGKYGKQSDDRFLFVVSRIDQLDIKAEHTAEDNPIRAKIDAVRADLRELGINEPRIFPVSAKIALNMRNYNRITAEFDKESADSDFKRYRRNLETINETLINFMPLSASIRSSIQSEIEQLRKKIDEKNDTREERLRYIELLSGVPALELTIIEYLHRYFVPARITDTAQLFNESISKANAEKELFAEIHSKKISIKKVEEDLASLQKFLSSAPEIAKLKQDIFPEKWAPSPTLKRQLQEHDASFENRINNKLSEMIGTGCDYQISDENIKHIISQFKTFMATLSDEMFSVYSVAVENEIKKNFAELVILYEEKLRDILGKMPEDLKDIMKKVDTSYFKKISISVQVNHLIASYPTIYMETVERDISWKEDGLCRAILARLPFTQKKTREQVTRMGKTLFGVSGQIKKSLVEKSSVVLQSWHDKALNLSKENYKSLRIAAYDIFDKADLELLKFKDEFLKKLKSIEDEKVDLEKYGKTLEWVSDFQKRLNKVLDLEE